MARMTAAQRYAARQERKAARLVREEQSRIRRTRHPHCRCALADLSVAESFNAGRFVA